MSEALVTFSEFDLKMVNFANTGLFAVFNQYEETGTGEHYNIVTMSKEMHPDPNIDKIKTEFKYLVALACGLYGNIDCTKKLSPKNEEFVDLVNRNITVNSIIIGNGADGYDIEVKAHYLGPFGTIKESTPKVAVLEEDGIKSTSNKYLYDSVEALKREVYGYLFEGKYAQLELEMPEVE